MVQILMLCCRNLFAVNFNLVKVKVIKYSFLHPLLICLLKLKLLLPLTRALYITMLPGAIRYLHSAHFGLFLSIHRGKGSCFTTSKTAVVNLSA